jgi:anaerobic magnesium-protoporphyrin IX monomethyl ester cyclase
MEQIIRTRKLERNTTGNVRRKLLLFVLPYFVGKTDALGIKTRSYLAFPYGPLTIATFVKSNSKTGSEVIICDLNTKSESVPLETIVAEEVRSVKPDFVGYSFMFDNSFSFLEAFSTVVAECFKEHRPLQLVGGAAATTAANEILDSLAFIDAVCFSEGESAILQLLDSQNPKHELTKQPWVTRASASRKPEPLYVDSLDDVVSLDYSLVEVEKYSMRESFSPFATYRYSTDVKQFFLVTSRGCPFKCTFCAEPALHGSNMRYASVDSIIGHVRELKERYGINVLTLYDDQLLIDVPRAKELFARLTQFDLRIEMPNGVTAVFIDDELAQLMKGAGVDTIPLAIESGSEFVLRHIINKPLRLPKLKKVMESLRKAEIFVQAFFVIGMPGELEAHRNETLNLIYSMDFDWASFSVAGPVRGSKLYEDAKKNGWLPKEYSVGKFVSNSAVLNIPGYDNQAIMNSAAEFNIQANFINSRALRIKDYVTARRLFMEVTERANNHAFAHFFLAQVEKLLGNLDSYNTNLEVAAKIFREDENWSRLEAKYNLSKFNWTHFDTESRGVSQKFN